MEIVLAREIEMHQSPDPELLEYAARQNLILLTHDLKTMPGHAYERIAAGTAMPGVIAVRQSIGIGRVISFLFDVWMADQAETFADQVIYQPTRSTH